MARAVKSEECPIIRPCQCFTEPAAKEFLIHDFLLDLRHDDGIYVYADEAVLKQLLHCHCALADLRDGSHRSSTIAKPATLMIHPMTTTSSRR